MGVNKKMDRQNRAKQFIPFAALKGYDEALSENEVKENGNQENTTILYQEAVPAITSFSKDGDIKPLYFSINGTKIQILKIKWQEVEKEWVNHFKCEIVINNTIKEVDLYFYKNKNVWTLKGFLV